jgi:hypothetical protein
MNKHLKIGPGGRRCVCCFPAPGSKARKLEFRRAKRKEKREAFRLEKLTKSKG